MGKRGIYIKRRIRFYRVKQQEICPYCGQRCISFRKIIQAGNARPILVRGRSIPLPICPSCGVILHIKKRIKVLYFSCQILLYVAFLGILLNTGIADHPLKLYILAITLLGSQILLEIILGLTVSLQYWESENQLGVKSKYFDNFYFHLSSAIQLCNNELTARKRGIIGECTQSQLSDVILPELNKILEMVRYQCLPPETNRYFNSLICAVTEWNWDTENPSEILKMLKELDLEYKEYKNQ